MRKLLISFFASLLLMPFYGYATPVEDFQNHYDALLARHVYKGDKEGFSSLLVNYGAWATDSEHAQAMQTLAQIDPAGLSGDSKKAFWINAYNLLTIDLILQHHETRGIKHLGWLWLTPWKRYTWPIAGKPYSLDQIENDLLRPMGDPRIHFAINCASLSCPDLKPAIYRSQWLSQQLDEQTKMFLGNSHKGLALEGKRMKVSAIFDWFRDDFSATGGTIAFIKTYTPIPDDVSIEYMDYNWNLNGKW